MSSCEIGWHQQAGILCSEGFHGWDWILTRYGLQGEMVVCGRICCDSQGKLNAKSVLLEGSRSLAGGLRVPVDLSQVESYSLFPGQVSPLWDCTLNPLWIVLSFCFCVLADCGHAGYQPHWKEIYSNIHSWGEDWSGFVPVGMNPSSQSQLLFLP